VKTNPGLRIYECRQVQMSDSDKEIIQHILEGNVRSFATLVDKHKAKAMTLAIRILRNREEAEEALQDAFVRVFRALHSFEWKSSFSTWFYRIVYNTCVTAAGKKESAWKISLDAEEEFGQYTEVPSHDLPPDIQLESNECTKIIYEEVEKLPPAYGSTFTLFVLQELSYEEIVQVTGLPIGTVKARIFRARAILRETVAKRMKKDLPVRV
jgi:RNA polymerase sigma factor (sigma-70 family)